MELVGFAVPHVCNDSVIKSFSNQQNERFLYKFLYERQPKL